MNRVLRALAYLWQLFISRYFFVLGLVVTVICFNNSTIPNNIVVPKDLESVLDISTNISGEISSYAVSEGYNTFAELQVTNVDAVRISYNLNLRIYYARNPEIDKGSIINCRGKPYKLAAEVVDNYRSQSLVPVSVFCDEIVVTGQHNDPLGNLIAVYRRDCISLIHKYLPQPQASLLLGMLFGSDEPLSPQFRNVFNAANTAHIIAVSGFNISLIAGLLQTSSRYLGRKGSMIVSSCGLFVFMFFVGWDNIPALRAVIMHCYSSIAVWDGYRTDDLNGLGIAAVVIAVINPAACLGLSFQLTMAASLGMIILKPLLSKIITIPVLNNREVLTAFACQLATIPFLLSLNKTVSLWGIIANVGIAPLILPVMVCGAAGLLVHQFFPVLGADVFLPATVLLDLLCWIVHFFGTLAVTNASLIKELLLFGLGVFLWSYIYRTFINK